MKRQLTLIGSFAVSLVILFMVTQIAGANSLARAQEGTPVLVSTQNNSLTGQMSLQAAISTTFTYQGSLSDGGNPANGNYDFEFRLYDDADDGTLMGTDTETDVPVTDGLFTVQLDYGEVFTGTARFLEIGVRLGDSDGAYTTLEPRQPLNPAPYALALPGLWTQQNENSPNIIGGNSDNNVTNGVFGATISGGGALNSKNHIYSDFSTIGGGSGNLAGDPTKIPTGSAWATVAGGFQNYAISTLSTIPGGQANATYGEASTVGGGKNNWTTEEYSTVPGGLQAKATHYGEMAYASGKFEDKGDAQTSVYVLRGTTTNQIVLPTELFLDGTGERLTLIDGRTLAFEILVVGRGENGHSGGYQFSGVIERVGDTTQLVGSVIKVDLAEDSAIWDVFVDADNPNNSLRIRVAGEGTPASHVDVHWVATVRTVEVMSP
jgi:hypothetical protein